MNTNSFNNDSLISIQSEPDFNLPLSRNPKSSIRYLSSTIKRDKQILYILIVDDVAFNQVSLENVLKHSLSDMFQLMIDKCFDGQQCLDKIQENQKGGVNYDLIFMDINMPIMDGITATQKINEMEKGMVIPKQKIWICSANSDA